MRGLLVFGIVLGIPTASMAHGLAAEVRHSQNRLVIRVIFDDGTPIKSAIVRLQNSAEQTATTNENGQVGFPMPDAPSISFSADAGDGHVMRMTVNIPPGPWQENQLFTPGIETASATTQRLTNLAIGLVIITLATLVLMKILSRRQPS